MSFNDVINYCKEDTSDNENSQSKSEDKFIKGESLKEDLADLAHKQWSGWMEYLFKKSTKNEDGTVTIPAWAVDRWEKQINTDYADLSEDEQNSDRTEADKFLKVINYHKEK